MGGRNDNEDDAKWSDSNETLFLTILYERVKKDPNGTPSFKTSDWQEMDEEMYLACGERYGQIKLQGKFNRLRLKHRQFSDLLDHTGVTYLSTLNTVNAPEDVWQMFFMKNKSYRTFRRKGCLNYELLGQVFNKSTTIGHLHHASSQLPPTSDEERENEEEFMNHGVHVSGGGDKSGAGSSKGKRVADDSIPSCRRVKKGGSEKWDSCMEMLASSVSAKAEYFTAKTKKYRGETTEATSPMRDTYSVDQCMNVLENIDDVSNDSDNKALVQFRDPYWRKVFIKMSIERRKSWLKSLESWSCIMIQKLIL